jgi:hypothetical protein
MFFASWPTSLGSLIVLPVNQKWLTSLQARLASTRRGGTFSLIAQALSAIVALSFVVISAFRASLGQTLVVLQISAGDLWMWLVILSIFYAFSFGIIANR